MTLFRPDRGFFTGRLTVLASALLLLILPQLVRAACSPYAGLATINEISEQDGFIELKLLSSGIASSTSDAWQLEFCALTKKEALSCSGLRSVSLASKDSQPWLVMDANDLGAASINLAGMDVRLSDASGQTIDYVRVGNSVSASEDPTCSSDPAPLPYDTRLSLVGGESGKYARRQPDGNGDWSLSEGASDGKDTEGDTNDEGVSGPGISIDNIAVFQGEVAVFTITLDASQASDVLIDFETRDLSATAGQDYSGAAGTIRIAAGASQATLNVQTLNSANPNETEFFVSLSNPRTSDGSQFGTFASQAGIATILPVTNRLDSFEVSAAQTASVCAPLEVTIRALDQQGDVVTDYAGLVSLQTSSGSGNWSAGASDAPAGSLTPTPDTDNDGSANYQFASTDNGTVSLALANATADEITIAVTDSADGQQGRSAPIQFLENAILIDSVDPNGLDIVAEREHSFVARAVRRDPVDGECGLIPDYDGSIDLKAWLSRTGEDPGGNAPDLNNGTGATAAGDGLPASNNLSLTFNAGAAPFSLVTADVGQYRLNLLDDTSGIVQDVSGNPLPVSGISALWTVRPDRFELSVSGNPSASDASGPVFRAAGGAFDVQLSAVGAKGTPLPSYGREGTPQGAEFSHALVQPAGGVSGPLSGAGDVSGSQFSNGQVVVGGVSWNEVGIITLAANNASYLGVTPPVQGVSANVGRFIPDRFELSVAPGELASFCSTGSPFTYTGQDLFWNLMPEITIAPMGPGNYVTRNYTAPGFMKLAESGVSRNVPVADNNQASLSGVLHPVTASLDPGNLSDLPSGELVYTFASTDTVVYDKSTDTKVAPFSPDLTITISGVTDSDGVTAPAAPVQVTPLAPLEIRYGRWHLENVYGPENVSSLSMPFRAEVWNGSRFVEHGDDGCSAWSTASITDPEVYHALSADSGALAGGTGGPLSLQPNGSQGTDVLAWDVSAWFEDDWNGDGVLEDPVGLATFGVYRGHDRVIFWQER
ncbi:hypothetical protein LPB19_06525 [Marinobacter salinisoli]|uniref:Calx-beta domain-containing protein n=1 Tax=Marinobacter salinisoli TaxID=2769486 RepID=A0ABX7MV37_9GAMM|nr:DUF6701 domain-containing protein [Marinobacter salinisoli]QSP96038.1 hypothetical protein LPB19_06525 [Marinobacter salinisoli]